MTATSTYLCIPAATAVVVTGHACVRGMQRQYTYIYSILCGIANAKKGYHRHLQRHFFLLSEKHVDLQTGIVFYSYN